MEFFVGPSFQEAKGSSAPMPSPCDSGTLSPYLSIQPDR
jgi:hypothetical protein